MNVGQLQSALQALGYPTATNATPTQIVMLNSAYRDVLGGERWAFLEKEATVTCTPNQNAQSYSTITDLLLFSAIRITGQPNLENREPQVMRDMISEDLTPHIGTPRYWSLIAGQIYLYPAPSQAFTLTVDYIYSPPDLAVAGDTPVFPAQFHDVLVYGAAWLYAQRERDIYSSETWQAEYTRRLMRMRQSYNLRQTQTASEIKKGYWGHGKGLERF